MNLRDLRYIVAVADFGHFGRAAEACNVSQPTLSGQIRKLEEELGLAVFERVGHTVRPTLSGGHILAHARRALAAAEDIVAVAAAGRDPLAGPLHLGVIPTLGPYLMPYALPAVQRGLRSMRLVLVEDLTVRLIELVTVGKLDAAIIASDPETLALTAETLFDEDFWLVLGTDNPLAKKNKITIADIDPQSLLLLTDGHCLRDQALELCGAPKNAEEAIADMRATSLKTLLHMAAAGYGMTLIPALALKQEQPLPGPLVARRLSGTKARRRVRLIFRPSHPRRAALAALSKLIRASVKDVLEDARAPELTQA
ncbi:LysR family transcriptional regulator [Methylovirgula ligni]|uniref:LysR family hydrogen peroxide-inducible transcriptional activator n=1 Tax=Methylovirgula ligni TaxID=569860 RepID=A0A3D9YZA7_9HYPH|nr:LysR substrate-binding domain-containing protein [Methylovirgula ligni]QAY96465.1 LysR family transcriptional regulator [Methylovirgula ligni]REF84249.1 LysR family hydrogen peroxide-inducible transcriptional activator [Methylovirgula ligni]